MTDELSKDWKRIRQALKYGGAAMHTDGARYWFVLPIDSDIALQIIAHPAVLPDDEYQIDGVGYQTFRWRSYSPAQKVMSALKTERSVQ